MQRLCLQYAVKPTTDAKISLYSCFAVSANEQQDQVHVMGPLGIYTVQRHSRASRSRKHTRQLPEDI